MDSPEPDQDSPWGAHGVCGPAAIDPAVFFRKHGVYYQENATFGRLVQELDKIGQSSNPEGFHSFKHHISMNDVREILYAPNAILTVCSTSDQYSNGISRHKTQEFVWHLAPTPVTYSSFQQVQLFETA